MEKAPVTLSYVLPGDPTIIGRMRGNHGMAWSDIKAKRWEIASFLSEQAQSLFEAPTHLDVIFYLPLAKQPCQTKTDGKPHYQKPCLNDLVGGILHILEGYVFKPECIIVSINSKKFYDSIPRIELFFTKVQ